jgi:hypothetical protein
MLWMQYINPVLVVMLVVLVLLEILNVTECFCPGFTVSRLWCVQVTRVVKRTYQVRSQECSQRGSILDKHLHPIHNRCSAALFCLHAAVRTLLDAGLTASALRYMNATPRYAALTLWQRRCCEAQLKLPQGMRRRCMFVTACHVFASLLLLTPRVLACAADLRSTACCQCCILGPLHRRCCCC